MNLNNLAAVVQARGQTGEAERLYLRALAIKEKMFGPANVEVAMTANNLALLYKEVGKHSEADRLYRRALKTFEGALGAEHPNSITCRENYQSLLDEIRMAS